MKYNIVNNHRQTNHISTFIFKNLENASFLVVGDEKIVEDFIGCYAWIGQY